MTTIIIFLRPVVDSIGVQTVGRNAIKDYVVIVCLSVQQRKFKGIGLIWLEYGQNSLRLAVASTVLWISKLSFRFIRKECGSISIGPTGSFNTHSETCSTAGGACGEHNEAKSILQKHLPWVPA